MSRKKRGKALRLKQPLKAKCTQKRGLSLGFQKAAKAAAAPQH
jgi:hypothetical protein